MKIENREITGINILELKDDAKCYVCKKKKQVLHIWSEGENENVSYHVHLCNDCLNWKKLKR
jgi:hypothetical protein